ncbi:hypothetical protein JCM3774_000648 [Rhodotorula dairenensis]
MPPRAAHPGSLNDSPDATMSSPAANDTTNADAIHIQGAAVGHPDASLASSSPADSTSSSPDSLADAPAADVEAKATALLAMLSTVVPAVPHPGFEWHQVPRQVPTQPGEQEDARRGALDFIGKMLEKADRDDWMYKTPEVFGPPRPLRLREGASDRFEADQEIGRFARGGPPAAPWQDDCFNLDSYHVEGVEDAWDGFDDAAYAETSTSSAFGVTSAPEAGRAYV